MNPSQLACHLAAAIYMEIISSIYEGLCQTPESAQRAARSMFAVMAVTCLPAVGSIARPTAATSRIGPAEESVFKVWWQRPLLAFLTDAACQSRFPAMRSETRKDASCNARSTSWIDLREARSMRSA